MKHPPLIVGNWKLNPVTQRDAADLATALAKRCKQPAVTLAVAPPFPYLADVGKRVMKVGIALAAQDVFSKNIGAYTGEVSVLQLKDLGVSYVIIGHSERRALGETDEMVSEKVTAVLKQRLTPIVCIGERERDEQGNFYGVIEAQLRHLTAGRAAAELKKIVIAYEPIWAIGTGNTATADTVKEMQLFIESVLTKLYSRQLARSLTVLYGGSVKPDNARELHTVGGMNGFLVGGASLQAADFAAIAAAVT